MFVMSMFLRTMYLYDSVDHSIYNASKHVSTNEGYVLLSQSNGVGEILSRPLIVKAFVKSELEKNDFITNREKNAFDVLDVYELSGFDDVNGAGVYKISYSLPLPGGLPNIEMKHQIRVRSIWQTDIAANDSDPVDQGQMVYTTPHGRKTNVYHTHANCWSLKKSWKKPETVHTVHEGELKEYRECKICINTRLKEEVQLKESKKERKEELEMNQNYKIN